MECKIEKLIKLIELIELIELKKYTYQLLLVFLILVNATELKCENQEKTENKNINKQEEIETENIIKQEKIERKKLSNIKFSIPENGEILPKIKEIKTLKINERQYTIFRLKNGRRVVTSGEGEFVIAGEKYKINKIGDEVEIEDNSGAKIVVGGKE